MSEQPEVNGLTDEAAFSACSDPDPSTKVKPGTLKWAVGKTEKQRGKLREKELPRFIAGTPSFLVRSVHGASLGAVECSVVTVEYVGTLVGAGQAGAFPWVSPFAYLRVCLCQSLIWSPGGLDPSQNLLRKINLDICLTRVAFFGVCMGEMNLVNTNKSLSYC